METTVCTKTAIIGGVRGEGEAETGLKFEQDAFMHNLRPWACLIDQLTTCCSSNRVLREFVKLFHEGKPKISR